MRQLSSQWSCVCHHDWHPWKPGPNYWDERGFLWALRFRLGDCNQDLCECWPNKRSCLTLQEHSKVQLCKLDRIFQYPFAYIGEGIKTWGSTPYFLGELMSGKWSLAFMAWTCYWMLFVSVIAQTLQPSLPRDGTRIVVEFLWRGCAKMEG